MKRSLCSSDDSLGGALISICQTTDEHSSRNNQVYGREFQAILDGLDEEGCLEETGGYVSEKKRRLSVDQVKALEKNFEVENKLEPERKVKLAQELGLQPRQVAVWFQNRRARWKTKQLERDYGVLKANFDTLKLNYDTLQHDNEALLKQIRELKSKLNEEETESNVSVKEEEEMIVNNGTDPKRSHDDQESNRQAAAAPPADGYYQEPDQELINYDNGVLPDFKDGSSDSDSSAILNEDNGNSPNSITQNQQQHQLSISCLEFSKPPLTYYQTHQFVKMEEHNFFGDETCDFFSDDDEQAPTLPWYCSHQWT